MPTLEISVDQVYQLAKQLDNQSRDELVARLISDDQPLTWKELRRRIEERKQMYPISDEEIEAEVERAREEIYANRSKS